MERKMKKINQSLLLMSCLALASCSTFHKYATGRYYEIYRTEGLSACEFKTKFNACADTYSFDVKISDDNDRIALAEYFSPSDDASYFGFIRGDYARETQPMRDFIIWSKANSAGGKRVTVKRKAGNAVGYLFEHSDVVYVFDYIHSREDIPMLMLNIEGRGRYFGFTTEQVEKLLQVLDAWYAGKFTGEKLTG